MAKQRSNSVGIKELKDQASAIIESVQKTRRPIMITKNNRDVARIVPISEPDFSRSYRERLTELGLLASPARLSLKNLELEKISLTSSEAVAAIRSDREED